MQLLAEQLELQQIRNCSRRSLNIHTSVRYSFHFDKHFASHRPYAGKDACKSSCELFVTVASFFFIFNFLYLLHVSKVWVHVKETVVLTGML